MCLIHLLIAHFLYSVLSCWPTGGQSSPCLEVQLKLDILKLDWRCGIDAKRLLNNDTSETSFLSKLCLFVRLRCFKILVGGLSRIQNFVE